MCKQIITKNNTERPCCRMHRIQTYRYLHPFRKIDGISVCHINTEAFFQCRTSVREAVFDDKILRFLCIYKRSNIRFLSCDDRLHIFHTKLLQICRNLLTRTWCDLINHRPWESDNFFIAYIIHESVIYKALFFPFFCHCQYRLTQFCTIL